MNGEHTVFLGVQDFYVRPFILIHRYDITSTLVIHQVPGDDVTVRAGLHTGKEGLLQIISVAIERDESRVSTTEGNLILAVVPPVVDVGVIHGVSEAHHVVNLSPSMLADPAVAAAIVRIDGWRQQIAGGVLRRIGVKSPEVEGAHDTRGPIRMRQHERNGHLVLLR